MIYEVLLAFILVYETETATILSQPPTPVLVLEGQHLKLEWTFSVHGTFRRVQLGFSGSSAGFVEKFLTGSFIEPAFKGRLTAGTTERNATITFFSINRTDSADYIFAVLDSAGATEEPLKIIVEYPPSLITRAPDQVVLEGGPPISLTCTADGEPAPNITWTKVFANGSDSDVLFTGDQFILPSNRTIDGTYRCKASNGIGSDMNHTVTVVVNSRTGRFENVSNCAIM